MSRADKRHRVVHEEKNLRLFAFNNSVNSYRPQHGLEEPVIVLRTRIKKEDEHPALQWQPLAQQVFERMPMTHSCFVMDGTRLGSNTEQDEITHRGVEGPLLKRMSNMLSKLAPKRAQLVGAGTTAEIVAKTAICCTTLKNLIGRIILVCPSINDVARSVEAAEKRLHQTGAKVHMNSEGKPFVEAVVLLNPADAHMGNQWQQLLGKSFRVRIVMTGPSLFSSIASVAVPEVREERPTEGSRSEELKCYVITFRLSPYTKQAEQDVDLSPVTENPNLPPVEEDEDADDDDETDAAEMEEAPIASTETRCILAELVNVKNAIVRFEGNVVDSKTLANVHGKVELDALVPELKDVAPGTTVALSAQLSRDEDGRTRLNASTVANLATDVPASYWACGSNFPSFNYSAVKQYYGAALIRGRKIVLCRNLEGIWRGMRFPHRPHCESYYTPYESAIAAISDQCDVSADNFYFHPAIAPVTYYPANDKGACVTLFVALALTPSERNGLADDSVELLEQLHDCYDWYSFRAASAKLPTKAERDALVDIRRNVVRAYEAGLYEPLAGHGLFGDDLAPSSAGLGAAAVESAPEAVAAPAASASPATVATASSAEAAAASSSLPTHINVSELVVVYDPFSSMSVEEAAAMTGIEPRRVMLWDQVTSDANTQKTAVLFGGDASIVGGKGCIIVPRTMNIDVFAQQELPPFLPEDCPPSVQVIITAAPEMLDKAFLAPEAFGPSSSPSASFRASLEYAEVLVSRGANSFSPLGSSIIRTLAPELVTMGEAAVLPLVQKGVATPAASALSTEPCDAFFTVPIEAKLPFHPQKLAEMLQAMPWGPVDKVLAVSGDAWLSTRPLYKIAFNVAPSTVKTAPSSIRLSQSAPWWCCVEEGDRPEGLDTSDWDPVNGSRRQAFSVLLMADPAKQAEVTAKVQSAFAASLCDAKDFRHWHRLADPFAL